MKRCYTLSLPCIQCSYHNLLWKTQHDLRQQGEFKKKRAQHSIQFKWVIIICDNEGSQHLYKLHKQNSAHSLIRKG